MGNYNNNSFYCNNYNKILKSIYKTEYKEYVEKYSSEENVDPLLVYAIIKAESNFEEGATSNRGGDNATIRWNCKSSWKFSNWIWICWNIYMIQRLTYD